VKFVFVAFPPASLTLQIVLCVFLTLCSSPQHRKGGETETERILDAVEIVSEENWASSFGIPEIMVFKELRKQAPLLFKKTIVVVDLMTDSPEDVLATVTGCFASADSSALELGLGGAHIKVAYTAWQRHLTLYQNAHTLHRKAAILENLILLFALLTGSFSVLYAALSMGTQSKARADQIKQGILVLPIIAALLLTVQGSLRWKDKGDACETGAAAIASEIYKFRAKVGSYAETGITHSSNSGSGSDDEEEALGAVKESAAHYSRGVFVERVTAAFEKVMQQAGDNGALLYKTPQSMLDKFDVASPSSPFARKLRKHVYGNLYRAPRPKQGKADKTRYTSSARLFQMTDPDEFVGPLSLETYIDYRAKAVEQCFSKRAPRIALFIRIADVVGFTATSMGAILSILGKTEWVVLTVLLATTIENCVANAGWRPELSALNSGLVDIQNLLVWWESLSIVDRRTRSSKEHCLAVVENALAQLAAAKAVNVAASPTLAPEQQRQHEKKN
jgi:hypothetical protein